MALKAGPDFADSPLPFADDSYPYTGGLPEEKFNSLTSREVQVLDITWAMIRAPWQHITA